MEERDEKTVGQLNIRPLQSNRERLEKAEKLGMSQGKAWNKFMKDCWDDWFEKQKRERIREIQNA